MRTKRNCFLFPKWEEIFASTQLAQPLENHHPLRIWNSTHEINSNVRCHNMYDFRRFWFFVSLDAGFMQYEINESEISIHQWPQNKYMSKLESFDKQLSQSASKIIINNYLPPKIWFPEIVWLHMCKHWYYFCAFTKYVYKMVKYVFVWAMCSDWGLATRFSLFCELQFTDI